VPPPSHILSPSQTPTPPPRQQSNSYWGTLQQPLLSPFSLFANQAGPSDQNQGPPYLSTFNPMLRPLPLQYQPMTSEEQPLRTLPRRDLPRTPERSRSPPHQDQNRQTPMVILMQGTHHLTHHPGRQTLREVQEGEDRRVSHLQGDLRVHHHLLHHHCLLRCCTSFR
jgi:hypothetical protein